MVRVVNNYEPAVMVIFGVTGDLSKRYLLPALYHLCKDGLLPKPFRIVGTSRQQLQLDEFLGQVELCVLEKDNVCDPIVLKQLRDMMELSVLDPVVGDSYVALHDRLTALEDEQGVCLNRLYYLSIPPQLYSSVVSHLGSANLNGSCQHDKAVTRLLVEKPFGYDLTSAEELIAKTSQVFREEQTYRIDHYLAKDLVQNILLFRQKNPDLEARWNGQHVASITISSYEKIGIEGRHFYNEIGALRDLIQSHLWQLLGLIIMDLPPKLSSELIHTNKATALATIGPLPMQDIAQKSVRAQYDGYKTEVGDEDSQTETFAALRFNIPDGRWQGSELLLATGKALDAKRTEICVEFKNAERIFFRVQPNPGIEVSSGLQASTDFSDKDTPLLHADPDAYERVLIDAVRGDHTLFATADEILASWHSLQPVLEMWAKGTPKLQNYPKNSKPESLLK